MSTPANPFLNPAAAAAAAPTTQQPPNPFAPAAAVAVAAAAAASSIPASDPFQPLPPSNGSSNGVPPAVEAPAPAPAPTPAATAPAATAPAVAAGSGEVEEKILFNEADGSVIKKEEAGQQPQVKKHAVFPFLWDFF